MIFWFHFIESMALSVALCADTVLLVLGFQSQRRDLHQALKIVFVFSFAHVLMFSLGALPLSYGIHTSFSEWLEKFDHWLAALILFFIAVSNLIKGIKLNINKQLVSYDGKSSNFKSNLQLLSLAFAASFDALGAGAGFALSGSSIQLILQLNNIFVVTAMMSFLAIYLKNKVSYKHERLLLVSSFFILTSLGFKILIEHKVF
jgi:putative Mn2+ efflux pump MntP